MFIGLWVIFLQQKDELMEAEVHIGRVLLDTLSGAGAVRKDAVKDDKNINLQHQAGKQLIAAIIRVQNIMWQRRFAILNLCTVITMVLLIASTYWLVSSSSDNARIFIHASFFGSTALLVEQILLAGSIGFHKIAGYFIGELGK